MLSDVPYRTGTSDAEGAVGAVSVRQRQTFAQPDTSPVDPANEPDMKDRLCHSITYREALGPRAGRKCWALTGLGTCAIG